MDHPKETIKITQTPSDQVHKFQVPDWSWDPGTTAENMSRGQSIPCRLKSLPPDMVDHHGSDMIFCQRWSAVLIYCLMTWPYPISWSSPKPQIHCFCFFIIGWLWLAIRVHWLLTSHGSMVGYGFIIGWLWPFISLKLIINHLYSLVNLEPSPVSRMCGSLADPAPAVGPPGSHLSTTPVGPCRTSAI